MNIVDKNLFKIIKLKMLGEDIDDVADIKDITIQNKNFLGHNLNIDLSELVALENLESISLKFFEIDDHIIETLNKLSNLTKVEFLMCKFNTTKKISRMLKSITVYNCLSFYFNFFHNQTALEEVTIDHSGNVNINDLKFINNIKSLKLVDCYVYNLHNISNLIMLERLHLNGIELSDDFNISTLKFLKYLSLNGSYGVDRKKYLNKLKQQNIGAEIEFEISNLPIE